MFDVIRIAYLRLVTILLHNSHTTYYSDLPYFEAVLMQAISHAIFLAEKDRRPFNISRLAEHMGMPRSTMKRSYLDEYLIRKGVVRVDQSNDRSDHLLGIEPAIFSLPERATNVRRAADAIVAAAMTILEARGYDVTLTTRTDQPRTDT